MRPDGKHKPHLRQTLQQTERNSTRATSHFQACTLLVCAHASLLQITEHEFNQLLHQHTEKTQLWFYTYDRLFPLYIFFFFSCPTSVSGLGMNTGGLIFSVRSLKSHSSITYCTGILHKTHVFMNIISQKHLGVYPYGGGACRNFTPGKAFSAQLPHLLCFLSAEQLG